MEPVKLPKFTSGRGDGRFALVECGRLEAEEMIRTLDANYLSTFHLARPPGLAATGFVGDLWRTERITTYDDATSPFRLNQRREAKERRVREPC
jgi:hypothetical protein